MKYHSATLINNLWSDSSSAHIFLITSHEAFYAVALRRCLCEDPFWYLLQPVDSSALYHRSSFPTCSYLTSPLRHEYPPGRSGSACWHVHLHGSETCTNVQILERWWNYLGVQGAQTNSTWVEGALFCVQIREQACVICSAQRIDKISTWLPPLSHSWSTVCTVKTDIS